MFCEVRRTLDRQPIRGLLPIETVNDSQMASCHWQLHPRSQPREDGTRRITIEARSDSRLLAIDLTALEAAELMLELGAALEQAARDEQSASPDPSPLTTEFGRSA